MEKRRSHIDGSGNYRRIALWRNGATVDRAPTLHTASCADRTHCLAPKHLVPINPPHQERPSALSLSAPSRKPVPLNLPDVMNKNAKIGVKKVGVICRFKPEVFKLDGESPVFELAERLSVSLKGVPDRGHQVWGQWLLTEPVANQEP